MQEEENLQTAPEAPKKRGRKPKTENLQENVAPKKRGRPRKNADAYSYEQTESEASVTEQNDNTTRRTSLDDVLDSAVKQRREHGGNKSRSRTSRNDGPTWRDAPVVEEDSQQENDENKEESESNIFVYNNKSDDFEFTQSDNRDNDSASTKEEEEEDDDDEIPTSFSTTDDDLNPYSYRDQSDDEDNDDDARIAEAREYEKAVDDDETEARDQSQSERSEFRQKRDRNDKNNKFRDRQNQQNNRNRQDNRQNRQDNRQDFRNKNRQDNRQNNNNRNQQQNQRQNNNRQQNQQSQQRQNQQKKSRWTQSANADLEFINPADLPEWNILKNESLLNEKLAQLFFGKIPSWEMESFENATPITLDKQPIQTDTPTPEPAEEEKSEAVKEQNEAPEVTEIVSEILPEENKESENLPAEDDDILSKKNVSDMNYWELMANANDSAVKKFGLEKGVLPTEDKESSQNIAGDTVEAKAENEALLQEKFEEPNVLELENCGTIESVSDFDEIYKLGIREIQTKFDELGIEYQRGVGKSELITVFFKHALKEKKLVKVSGVLDVFQDGLGGAITFETDNYRLKRNSVYVPQIFIDKYGLKRGHSVSAFALPPREFGRENCPFAVAILSVMGSDPASAKNVVPFTDLVPYYPTRRIIMESEAATKTDSIPMRAVDLLTPIGFGQRALIVAPPRTGKTVLMQAMAKSIRINAPTAHLMILLVDERPEEVTDFKRSVDAEVIASTFDEEATNHVHAAEMVISRARRMVEEGRDVIILLDSITRLARAYNALMPNGGRTMSGGVEANALQKPKKFFGSARNIENAGSLTIIGTALVETGSKMDEVIFEEFKGTGNLELHLDRSLSDKRIYPAINIEKSGTRKEELLYHPDELSKIYALRRAMKDVPSTDAMEMLVQRLRKVRTNVEFLLGLNR